MFLLLDGTSNSLKLPRLLYKVNNGLWQAWTSFTSNNKVYLNQGLYIQFRNLDDFLNQDYNKYFTFLLKNGSFDLSGNIMSMLNWSETLKPYCFYMLFADKSNEINSISKLELPATTLADSCYLGMFRRCNISIIDDFKLPATELTTACYASMFSFCQNLTVAPELPATTLARTCYANMFYNCYNLTKAPELPATTLANGCYYLMFMNCTRLTEAPELPATTLTESCYYGMFLGCGWLTKAPELPATTLVSNCYANMFLGCYGLTEAPELPATILADYCYQQMFNGCYNLTEAPELPATTLAYGCYQYMFDSCGGLTEAPELPATVLAANCYNGMFQYCENLTKAPELPATTLTYYCYQQMFNGCYNLNYIKVGFTNWGDYEGQYTFEWLNGVSSEGTFIKPVALELKFGPSYIPEGWTIPDVNITKPLTFTFNSEGHDEAVGYVALNGKHQLNVQYRRSENELWQRYDIGTTITLYDNLIVQFQNLSEYLSDQWEYNKFSTSVDYNGYYPEPKFVINGNVMSMLNWSVTCTLYCFQRLFETIIQRSVFCFI